MRGRHHHWIFRHSVASLPEEELGLDTSATCIAALKVCRESRSIAHGRQLHVLISKNGLDRDALVGNFIIQMYDRCGYPQEAKIAFDRIAFPTSYSWNLLLSAFAHARDLSQAQRIYKEMPWPDIVSANIMINAYGQAGEIGSAMELFQSTSERDLVTWNSILAALAKNKLGDEAFHFFRAMDLEGFVPNKVSFVSLLHACSSNPSLSLPAVRMIQSLMSPYGYDTDVIAATALLDLLGKSGGSIVEAKKIFDRIRSPNSVSSTTMLILLLKSSDISSGVELFHRMPGRGIIAWNAMVAAMASKDDLDHSKGYFDSMPVHDVVSMNSLLAAYSHDPGLVDPMRELFDGMESDRNLITWNTMIFAYAQAGRLHESLNLFKTMLLHGHAINQVTLVSIIDACAGASNLQEGRKIHALVGVELGLSTTALANVLIKLYTNCEMLEYAREIFESMARPDVVSATAMITAYGRQGCPHEAKRIFDATREHDVITWTAMLCASSLEQAKILFRRMPFHDQMSTNTMIVAYGQHGYVEQSKSIFDQMPRRNIVSWNAMVAAYTVSGHVEDALQMLPIMYLDGEQPNKVTFLAAVDAAAVNGSVSVATSLHSAVNDSGLLHEHAELGASLVNMYGRCGCALAAQSAFNVMAVKTYVSWNSLITAYAQNGHADVAVELTWLMEVHGFVSNEVTFLSNLFACSHAGMLGKAWKLFLSMRGDYGIEPQMDHYLCVIDLLGRLGTMDGASDLIDSMPMEPSVVGWKSLLGASRVHSDDIEQGLIVASWNCGDNTADI